MDFALSLGAQRAYDKFGRRRRRVCLRISIPVGGNPNRIRWSSDHENLAALEAQQGKLLSDPKYMDMVAKGADNFIPGSIHDEIWRTL
jgi:hypothetical protein